MRKDPINDKNIYRKKLIEVALPLDAINKAAAKEKSIRHGHPSTLHIWWARRPLAACRAVLFASLIDDPGNYLPEGEAEKERQRLFKLIEKMVLWENTSNVALFKEIQKEIKKSVGGELPPVYDPFCGGGSIPLEAQRLALPAYASDLNPVAVLITKAMIEIPPRFTGRPPVNPTAISKKANYKRAEGLAVDIEYYGEWIKSEAKKKISHLYPTVNGKIVIAWIWTRTVKCPNPACGAEMPLVHTFELFRKASKIIWAQPVINKGKKEIEFQVDTTIFPSDKIPEGTVNRRGAKCVCCESNVPLNYVRSEGKSGRMKQKLMAIISEGDTTSFLSPIKEHDKIARSAKPEHFPDAELAHNTRDIKTVTYGMSKISELFTHRQLVAISTFSDLLPQVHTKIMDDAGRSGFNEDNKTFEDGGNGSRAYADAIVTYLAFAVDRCVNYWSSLTPWGGSFIVQTFKRQSISMAWDYAEANPFSNSTGNWSGAIDWITMCLRISVPGQGFGKVVQLDAASSMIGIKALICTDPPYYNNINYSDLSDFFYVWLRRTLGRIYPMLFSTMLVPKTQELVANPFRFGGDQVKADNHFITGLSKSFKLIKESSLREFPITIFYAVKEMEQEIGDNQELYASTGWQTMLEGLIAAGFQINGTWPLRTERDQGIKTGDNFLASSILLVCRPRLDEAPLATKREFMSALKKELPGLLVKLQYANIAPVDLAQAAIGPGVAIFSRYSKVLEPDGSQMTIRIALQVINQELDAFLNAHESELDQETRFCIAWFEQYGMDDGPYGQADILVRAKNTTIDRLSRLHLVKAAIGKVRLLKRHELAKDLDISNLERLPIWLCTQKIIEELEDGGEAAAAKLVLRIGAGQSEMSKDLAYRLYSICERKGWAVEALAYNSLVTSWPAIQDKLGLGSVPAGQTRL